MQQMVDVQSALWLGHPKTYYLLYQSFPECLLKLLKQNHCRTGVEVELVQQMVDVQSALGTWKDADMLQPQEALSLYLQQAAEFRSDSPEARLLEAIQTRGNAILERVLQVRSVFCYRRNFGWVIPGDISSSKNLQSLVTDY